jgi:hypothetical protein
MKTYIAAVNDEPLIAFRAQDDDDAQSLADDASGYIRGTLLEYTRLGGEALWDGKSEIRTREATPAEHGRWLAVLREDTGQAVEGLVHDPEVGDDADDAAVVLVPIEPQDDDDDDNDDEDGEDVEGDPAADR